MEKCVFLGYPEGYKGWKFYNPTSKRTLISERADFDKRYFPMSKRSPLPSKPLLVLSVCALLLCLWTHYLVITSAPSFHGSSHDLWLMFSFVSPCLLCLYS